MPQGDRDIILFDGGKGGYGWATDIGAHGYHWAINIDCRNGRADLVAGPISVTGASPLITVSSRPSAILNWEDDSGIPLILTAHGFGNSSRVNEFQDSANSIADSAGFARPITGAAVYHNKGTELAYFCDGSSNSVIRTRTKAARGAATYTAATSGKADDLIVIGGDFWRVVDKFKLEKLTINTDPAVDDNWNGVQIEVGIPSFPINKVLDFGGSPLPMTGQGVFRYNPSPTVARFENLTPFIIAHKDNGRGGFADGRGRVYYPTVTGRILVLSFGSQSQQGPLRFQEIDRDTPFGRIQTMAADEEYIYGVLDPGFVKTQKLGISVQIDDGGAFASPDPTIVATDGKGTTNVDVSALAVSGTDFIYVGADEPFWGVYFQMHTISAMNTLHGWVAEYSTGSGWTAFSELDSTIGLRESGAITLDPTADVYASGLWLTQTVNSVSGKYWLRFTPPPATSQLVNAKIAEVYVIPYRPSFDTANFPEVGAALAGALPKVIVGQWRGENIIWHDWLTLVHPKPVGITVSATTSTASVGESTLYLTTPTVVLGIPIGPDALPARAAWPKTNGIIHAIGFSGNNFGSPVNVKSVDGPVVIHGSYLQQDDNLTIAYRWDNDDRWHTSDNHKEFPVVLEKLEGRGRELHMVAQIDDGSIDAHSPYITHAIVPEASWTDHGPLHDNLGSDFVAPQVI